MEFLEIGYTKKAFGTRGEIKIHIEDAYLDYALAAKALFIKIRGDAVPFFIESIREKGDLFVKFDDIHGPEESEFLHGKPLFIQKLEGMETVEKQSDLQFYFCIDFNLLNEDGKSIGKIIDVQEFPQQEMAVVSVGAKEVYIPLHEKLVLNIDHINKTIQVNFPEELLDL